jgi:thioredoxin 1
LQDSPFDAESNEPRRAVIDALAGPVLLQFGAGWCGYCQAAQPLIAEALTQFTQVSPMWIEDGKGKRLGRSFGVKLWPTLIFLKDGKEIARLVRPTRTAEIAQALAQIAS